MAISERRLKALYTALTGTIGADNAETLMSAITDIDHLVTKDDLRASEGRLRAEISDLRTELRTEILELRSDMKTEILELRSDMKTEILELRSDMNAESIELRTEAKVHKAELHALMVSQISDLRTSMHRWNVAILVAVIGALASLRFG